MWQCMGTEEEADLEAECALRGRFRLRFRLFFARAPRGPYRPPGVRLRDTKCPHGSCVQPFARQYQFQWDSVCDAPDDLSWESTTTRGYEF